MKHTIANAVYSTTSGPYTWDNPLNKHTTTLSEEIAKKAELDRKRQNLAIHMESLAEAYGLSAEELYRFFAHTLGTEDGKSKLLTWRAARRLTK